MLVFFSCYGTNKIQHSSNLQVIETRIVMCLFGLSSEESTENRSTHAANRRYFNESSMLGKSCMAKRKIPNQQV